MSHENGNKGKSYEWFTPKYIFNALGAEFDLDVAHPPSTEYTHVPTKRFLTKEDDGLLTEWEGLVWMNPPFGNQKNKLLWINKFIDHSNGIALMPDRTSCSWWQHFAKNAHAILFVRKKIKFIRPDGSYGNQPSNGTTLFAIGAEAVEALKEAEKQNLGLFLLMPRFYFLRRKG